MIKLWFERGAWASARARRYLEKVSPHDIRRIGVIRHAALGDMVLVRPFLVEVKQLFPNAEIVLSVVSNYMEGIPYDLIDSLHVTPGNHIKGLSLPSRIKIAREIGALDILFDLADTTRSRYICMFASVGVRIGMSYSPYLSRVLHDAAVWRSDFVFEADNMLHTLMLLGAKPSDPISFFRDGQGDKGCSSEKRILYFPFASTSQKMWPIERWVSLILQGCELWPTHLHVILSGSHPWEQAANVFRKEIPEPPPNLQFADPCCLDDLMSVLRSADLLVSNDTGVRNLAISLDVPTVGIFFKTIPYRYLPRGGPHLAAFLSNGATPSADEVIQLISTKIKNEAS